MNTKTAPQQAGNDGSLREALRNALGGNAILFLGSGAAKAAYTRTGEQLPTGQQLADALASDCGLDTSYPLDSISEHFLSVRSETALINSLRKHLNVSNIGAPLTALASIPWSRIWTTNYDNAFEKALESNNTHHFSLTTADDVRNAQGNRLILMHINGALNRIKQSLTQDFVLTSQSYATQEFIKSEWAVVFRNDLQRAGAIIFIGYSLADIDIARLIFNPNIYHAKIHFIDQSEMDPVLKTKLSKFGVTHPIGLEQLRSVLEDEKAQWVPPKLIENYQCWSREIARVSLPRERFWDIPVPKSTRQRDKLFGPGRPASVAATYFLVGKPSATTPSMAGRRFGCACMSPSRLRDLRSLRHSGNTPAPYTYRGLPASCFALPWRAVSEKLSPASDDDFYKLILQGVTQDGALLSQIETPNEPVYTIVRDCEEACLKHLSQPNAVVAVIGSFANGKTITLRSVTLQLAAQGQNVFIFDQPRKVAYTELQRLCQRDENFVVVLENYSRNLDLVDCFCRYAPSGSSLLISERAEVHELRFPALKDKIKNRELKVLDIDLLEDEEITRLASLLEFRGLWGERAGLRDLQRIAYLKYDCGRQMQAILIDVANSPQVKKRLQDIVTHFESVEGGLRVLITLCLLQAIGEQPRIDITSELLGLSYDAFQDLTKDNVARQILAVQSGVASFRSPVIASAVLNGLHNATTITEIATECIMHGERARRADPYLGMIAKELMRFANLDRILPDKGKRVALQNLYEQIKTVPTIRANPHYWLQYAMARLSLGELQIARKYFEQSYSYAEKFQSYDTFQIDNHFCRLLLREAESTTDSDEAFNLVDKAMQILKRQVLRENRHYPYRSAWNLEGVAKRHGKNWTAGQRQAVASSAAYLVDASTRLDDRIARSVAVVGGVQRLNSVIKHLSTLIIIK